MYDSQIIFDRAAVRRHRDRAAPLIERVRPVLQETSERLLDRLDDIKARFTQALDIGGRGVVAPQLRARGIDVVSCDLSPRMAARESGAAVVADEEFLPFVRGSFDLVVANLSLHWVNDLPGALIQLRMALRPDGLLLASFPTLGTLDTLRSSLTEIEAELTGGASPRIAPFIELQDGAGLLQRAGFVLPVADGDSLDLAYDDPLALLLDLRAGGETNAVALRNRRPPPRALFPRALARMAADERQVRATLRIATLTGWAPQAAG
jgi:NADH dehydrogenase [ubiquinone] 1 alpha subcomplex assembly factor 5